jgi:hypothetical protein
VTRLLDQPLRLGLVLIVAAAVLLAGNYWLTGRVSTAVRVTPGADVDHAARVAQERLVSNASTAGCRSTDSRWSALQGQHRIRGPFEPMALLEMSVRFCWNAHAGTVTPDSKHPFVWAQAMTQSPFGVEDGYRLSYGIDKAQVQRRGTVQARTVAGVRAVTFTQTFDVLKCKSGVPIINAFSGGPAARQLPGDRADAVPSTPDGCHHLGTFRHEITAFPNSRTATRFIPVS